MTDFKTKRLPPGRDAVAPDGSDVRISLGLNGGGMAHFEHSPAQTSTAVTHRTVEEIWFSYPEVARCGANEKGMKRSSRSTRGFV